MKDLAVEIDNRTNFAISFKSEIKGELFKASQTDEVVKEVEARDLYICHSKVDTSDFPLLFSMKFNFVNPSSSHPVMLYIRLTKDAAGLVSESFCVGEGNEHCYPSPHWSRKKKYTLFWFSSRGNFRFHLHRTGWKRLLVSISSLQDTSKPNDLIPRILHTNAATDRTFEYIFENERKNHCLGGAFYSKGALFPWERSSWTDEEGNLSASIDLRTLRSGACRWITDWSPVIAGDLTDDEGWMYSGSWNSTWHKHKSFGKFVRRRIWIRKYACSMEDQGIASSSAAPLFECDKSCTERLRGFKEFIPGENVSDFLLDCDSALDFDTLKALILVALNN